MKKLNNINNNKTIIIIVKNRDYITNLIKLIDL